MLIRRKALPPMKLFKVKAELVKRFGREALVAFNELGEWKDVEDIQLPNREEFIAFLREKGLIEEMEPPQPGPKASAPSPSAQPAGEGGSEGEEKGEEEGLIKVAEEEEDILIKPIGLEELGRSEGGEGKGEEKEEREGEKGREGKEEGKVEEQRGERPPEEVEGEKEPVEGEGEEGKGEEEEEGERGEELEGGPTNEEEEDVFSKFGEEGLRIYRLIDGKRTIAEIAIEANTTIDKVIRVVKYLQEKESVEIKKPEEVERSRFSPLAGGIDEVEGGALEKDKALWVVEKVKRDFILEAKVKLEVALKYGKEGRLVLEALKEGKDVVEIVKETKVPLPIVESVVEMLEKKEKFIERRYLTREEVRRKYGEDSYIIYKKYGKKGVLFYELLGEDLELKKIKELIGEEDNEKVVDMFLFIRQTLGIELPVDRETLLKKLSS